MQEREARVRVACAGCVFSVGLDPKATGDWLQMHDIKN
jgi:hypothetical protein